MLIRNCETTNLFDDHDFNARVSVFKRNPKYYTKEALKDAWIETIKDSLFSDIYCRDTKLVFSIHSKNKTLSQECFTANEIIAYIKNNYEPCSIRISVTDNIPKTWIILIAKSQNEENTTDNLSSFFNASDFNVRMTPWYYTKNKDNMKAFKEVFRDSLGGGIVNSTSIYAIAATSLDGRFKYHFCCPGLSIVNILFTRLKYITPIRLDILEDYNKGARTWIIYPIES